MILFNNAGVASSSGETPDTVDAMAQHAGDFVAALGFKGVRSLGLDTAQGLRWSESYYWDLNDRTRAWNDRVKGKTPNGVWPNKRQICSGS